MKTKFIHSSVKPTARCSPCRLTDISLLWNNVVSLRVTSSTRKKEAMPGPKTEKVKLVTIITPFILEERIAAELTQLGATGYSTSKVEGHGKHGPRKFGIVDGANVRLEVLVHEDVATQILANLVSRYAGEAVVAYAVDAVAIPTGHFG
jgi:nitrogen regulatory protein PII